MPAVSDSVFLDWWLGWVDRESAASRLTNPRPGQPHPPGAATQKALIRSDHDAAHIGYHLRMSRRQDLPAILIGRHRPASHLLNQEKLNA